MAPPWSPDVEEEPVTEEADDASTDSYGVLVEALGGLTLDDVAAMEYLVLREVATWAFSDRNPGRGFDRTHAWLLAGALFTGMGDARGVEPRIAPHPSEAILATRRRLVEGAHELASLGTVSVDIIVEARLVASTLDELERCEGDPEALARSAYLHLLYALACGERRDQEADVMRGIVESFGAWTALLAEVPD